MRRSTSIAGIVLCAALTGCGLFSPAPLSEVPAVPLPNPALIPAGEPEFVWLQVVDAVDDYFRIARQQPLQNSPAAILEGRLDTAPQIGASLLEPWRKDSTPGFERLQSTLQTIRRTAHVIVRPHGGGYELEVIVLKDLEDVDRSQSSGASGASVRHDGTIVRTDQSIDDQPVTLGWIPQGRDFSLEQQILADIIGRITGPEAPGLLGH